MIFDLSKAPPTAEELVAERARHEETLRRCRRLDRGLAVAAAVMVAAALGAIWRGGFEHWRELATLTLMAAMGAAAGGAWATGAQAAAAAAEVLRLRAALVRASIGGVVAAVVIVGATTRMVGEDGVAVAVAAAVVVATAVAAAAAGIFGHTKWIDSQRRKAMDGLRRIDIASTECCPQVLAWCREHEELASYQRQVVAMNRFLTEGEVRRMSAWVMSVRERADAQREEQRRQAAKERREAEEHAACRALRTPIVTART